MLAGTVARNVLAVAIRELFFAESFAQPPATVSLRPVAASSLWAHFNTELQ